MIKRATWILTCILALSIARAAEPPDNGPAPDAGEKDGEQYADSMIPGYDDVYLVEGRWADGAAYYREELIKALSAEKPDLRTGQQLLYAFDVCRLFPAVKAGVGSPDDTDFAQWLLANPDLVRLLTAAVRPEDDPAGVFRVLYVLKTKAPLRKAAFENLMVALAVVYDKEVTATDLVGDGGKVMELFRYYVKNAGKFRDSPKMIPYFLLKYVVDNRVSAGEREWALERYGGSTPVARLYASVPYDTELYDEGSSRKRERLVEEGYTLKNIKKFGGLCGDQAYFAASVCKSIAIPAVSFAGRQARRGAGHAWAGAARRTGDGWWQWEESGRYGGRGGYLTGKTQDPQTGRRISDRDCWLETQLSRVSTSNRLRARFCLAGALLMDEEGDTKQAAKYLKLAVQLNPYYTDAWMTIATFCSERKLKTDTVWSFYEAMIEHFKDYPQFTRRMFGQLRKLIPEDDIKRHTKLYDMTWKVYQRRHPDIGARILAEKGDYLLSQNKPKAAFTEYYDAVMRYRTNGPIVEMLLKRIEKVYRSRKAVRQYIKLVESVMSKYRDQRAAAMSHVGYRGTTYFKLAKHLRDLHVEVGDAKRARDYEKLMKPIKK